LRRPLDRGAGAGAEVRQRVIDGVRKIFKRSPEATQRSAHLVIVGRISMVNMQRRGQTCGIAAKRFYIRKRVA
jgi:hypothetical protein